jgi:hypothetical protein
MTSWSDGRDQAVAVTLSLARGAGSLPTSAAGLADFLVRPSKIDLSSAFGGELVLHWHSWTASGASATGTSNPDHGVFPVRVRAHHVHDGVLTQIFGE